MPTAYERRLVLFYLSNVASRLRVRDEGPTHLVSWLRENEEQLGIRCPRSPGDVAEDTMGHHSRDREVLTLEWHRLVEVLKNALATATPARLDRTARRVRRLARATRLSRTDMAILEFTLRHRAGSLVSSLIEHIGELRYWDRNGFRLGNPLLPCMLGLSPDTVYGRFASDGPVVTSGLMSIDDDGDATLLDRLTRLHWLPKEAGSDVQELIFDEAGPTELRWSDFDHVAGDRDHLERILNGALRSDQKGVNVLVYGPSGTGKTEFCKTLAALPGRRIGWQRRRTFSLPKDAGTPARATSAGWKLSIHPAL